MEIVQLVEIRFSSSIFQSAGLRFRSHGRRHIHQIKLTNSEIGEYVNITGRNGFCIIKGIR